MAVRDLDWLTPEIQEVQAYHQARIAALYAGERPSEIIAIAGRLFGRSHGLGGNNDIDMLKEPDAWLDDVLSQMAENAAQAADRVTYRPMVIELDALGTHYIDALLGANVYFHEGQVWSETLDCDLMELSRPDLSKSEVFQASVRLAQLAAEASRGHLFVSTPVLSCPINIGINLFGQRVLLEMMERPNAARYALRVINDVILECTQVFLDVIPDSMRRTFCAGGGGRYAPPGFGEIDGCATQLVSAHHYQEFFAPLDEEILDLTPHGGMIHLCGACAQHISAWSGMKKLRSAQLSDRATEDLELFFQGLRPDQILYVSPTAPITIETIERILEITGGERLILQRSLEEPIPLEGI